MPVAKRVARIAVLASGRGSNLQALIDAIAAGTLVAELVGVFSDRPPAPALALARDAGIFARRARSRRIRLARGFRQRAVRRRRRRGHRTSSSAPVICACSARTWSNRAQGRLVNIHPSLLPAFKGLRTHARALAEGVREHGASVHFVTPDLDGGPVIAQTRVPVLDGDDADTLAARVLAREHPAAGRQPQVTLRRARRAA